MNSLYTYKGLASTYTRNECSCGKYFTPQNNHHIYKNIQKLDIYKMYAATYELSLKQMADGMFPFLSLYVSLYYEIEL